MTYLNLLVQTFLSSVIILTAAACLETEFGSNDRRDIVCIYYVQVILSTSESPMPSGYTSKKRFGVVAALGR